MKAEITAQGHLRIRAKGSTEVYALRKALGMWEGPTTPMLEIVMSTDRKYETEQVITIAQMGSCDPKEGEDNG